MKAIGGYFELELRKGDGIHPHALALNSARHCFEHILRVRKYRKVYIPYYTCEVVLEPISRLGVEVARYGVNEQLEPVQLPNLLADEAFLYTNYFGIKQNVVESLAQVYGARLIVDNAQAFYAPPLPGIDTFYSPRKFFGVPDGGYVYTQNGCDVNYEQDISCERMSHLLRRIDLGAEAGYADFRANSKELCEAPILRMSKLTEALLSNIDYDKAARKRRDNFKILHTELGKLNRMDVNPGDTDVPMVYPFWTHDADLRQRFIKNKIFVATYWPGICERFDTPELEKELVNGVLPLPIDQRYGHNDIKKIFQTIIN